MRTPALACAVFAAAAALSPALVAAVPFPALGKYEADIVHPATQDLATGGSVLPSSLKAARDVPAVTKFQHDMINGNQPVVSGETLMPSQSIRTRSASSVGQPKEARIGVVSPARDIQTTGGSMVPASPGELIQSRDVPRRIVVGTAIAGSQKIGPRRLSDRALDKDTAGGNAYSGASGDVSGGGPDASLRGPASHFSASSFPKRTDDAGTMGGNAYTGSSGDVSGGSITNIANNDGMPTLMNINSNNGGAGGTSASGCASGGHTNSTGAGGNAYSGSSGKAQGGSVSNVGGMINMNSNNAGAAGTSQSGCAVGGNVGTEQAPTNTDENNAEEWDFY